MPPPATPATQNEIVNRAFQSVTGLTPEAPGGGAPVGYGGEARQAVDLADEYKFGAAQAYTPPAATPAPAPMPVQNVPVNPVINVPPPAPPASSTPSTPTGGTVNPIPPKPVYPVGRNIPWQQTTKYWQDMDAYRKAGGT
jgi:hypothetical protein